jgi:hypothetical protein
MAKPLTTNYTIHPPGSVLVWLKQGQENYVYAVCHKHIVNHLIQIKYVMECAFMKCDFIGFYTM